jgi:hypothetical protein
VIRARCSNVVNPPAREMRTAPVLAVVFFLVSIFAASPVDAATYYVAPTGNNANPGTIDRPFASMAQGQQAAVAGDTVYFRGGTYRFVSNTQINGVLVNKSGTSGNRIKYWAYPDETPVFDFSGMTTLDRITGLRVTGSWIHIKGLEIKLVPQNITTQNESWGIYNAGGTNNIYEMLDLHHNMGPGFFIGSGGNNLILNCDSHHNYDPKSRAGDGENADGFGCHPQVGDTGNVFRGIRAWWNTDDGYDSINAFESCLVENSWAWLNGYLPDTMTLTNRNPALPPGNGNGFKLGGYGIAGANSPATPPKHTIRFSLAFLNAYAGFFANYHTTGNFYYNNTGFMNVGADFNMLGLTANTSVLRNNLAYGPSATANMNGTDAMNNSWNLPVQVTAADFQSISTLGVDGPRQADGSLPAIPFLRLVAGSDLVDKGTSISFPFDGVAPDLGAFEGVVAVAGTGTGGVGGGATGTGGTAGITGSGGAAGRAGSSGGTGVVAAGGSSAIGTGGARLGGGIGGFGTGEGATGGSPRGPAAGTGGGTSGPGAGSGANSTTMSSSGCGCHLAGNLSSPAPLAGFSIALVLIGRTRRSRTTRRNGR